MKSKKNAENLLYTYFRQYACGCESRRQKRGIRSVLRKKRGAGDVLGKSKKREESNGGVKKRKQGEAKGRGKDRARTGRGKRKAERRKRAENDVACKKAFCLPFSVLRSPLSVLEWAYALIIKSRRDKLAGTEERFSPRMSSPPLRL